MKKTLIALAALAASGATFAQATISGNVGFSWQQSPVKALGTNGDSSTGNGTHTQGFAINDGEIYISAKEDLGGGMSATARGGFTMRGRSNAIGDRDATVGLTGGFGGITVGAFRSCGSLMGVLSGAVTGSIYSSNESNNFTPLDKCSLINAAVYSMPVGPVMLSGVYGEFESSVSATSSTDRGNATGITFTDLGGVYNSGPLMASVNVTSFAAVGALKIIDGVVRTRVAGTYNAGVAKLGLGYQNKTGGSADQYVASVAVPMGNATFGLDYTARAAQGTLDNGAAGAGAAYALGASRDGDKASSSVGLGVTYNFSKTTTLNASYITYSDAGANGKFAPGTAASAAGTNTAGNTSAMLDTEYRIRLMKAF